jgi:hypothetical protein
MCCVDCLSPRPLIGHCRKRSLIFLCLSDSLRLAH